MRSRSRPGSCLLLLLSAISCSPLPELEPDTCGNGVVEAPEECDLYVPEGVQIQGGGRGACGLIEDGPERACRFLCANEAKCPVGWACGAADGVCRFASGQYEPVGEPYRFPAQRIEIADVDGDRLADVIGSSEFEYAVLFGTGEGHFSGRLLTPALMTGRPTAADASNDGKADLLVPIRQGVEVALGAADQSLMPQIFTSNELVSIEPALEVQLIMLRLGPPCFGAEVVRVALDQALGSLTLSFRELGDDPAGTIVQLPKGLSLSRATILTRDLDGDGADELVIGFSGHNEVLMFTTVGAGACLGVGSMFAPYPEGCPSVDLGQRTIDKGLRFTELGDGGPLELLINARSAADRELTLAIGPAPAEPLGCYTRQVPDARFTLELSVGCPFGPEVRPEWPLAAGDFDGDGQDDFVVPEGLLLTRSVRTATVAGLGQAIIGTFCPVSASPTGRFVEALVLDINRDGHLDVAASDGRNSTLFVYTGAGSGLFAEHAIDTEGAPRLLTFGDFDGDLVGDVAFVEGAPHSAEGTALTVLYGEPLAAPGRPVVMGRLEEIAALSAERLFIPAEPDTLWDLVLTGRSKLNGPVVMQALVFGNSERRMFAPVGLISALTLEGPGQRRPGVLSAHLGRFQGTSGLLAVTRAPGTEQGLLWRVPQAEQRIFDVPRVERLELSGCALGFIEGCLIADVADLDGDAQDELLLANRRCSAEVPAGRLCIVHGEGEVEQRPLFVSQTSTGAQVRFEQLLHIEVTPVDAAPGPELLAVFGPAQGSRAAGALALYRDAERGFVDPPLVRVLPERVPGSGVSLGAVLSATPANTDRDGPLEILVLTTTGVFIVDLLSEGELSQSSVAPGALIEEQRGMIQAVDLNTDGLSDLIFGAGERLNVFLARPGVLNPKED